MGDVFVRILFGILFSVSTVGVTVMCYVFTMAAIRHYPYSLIVIPAIVVFYLIGYVWEEWL